MADIQTRAYSGSGTKFEQHIYYRRPLTGDEPGWIVIQGTNMERQRDLMLRGFEPLNKFGTLESRESYLRQTGALGKDEPMDPWRVILEHPEGPKEFPAEQVMILRWYQDEHCPIPGTKFPQLGGHSIVEYQCPECRCLPFAAIDGVGGIEPLGRHLRIVHSWDRASLVKYGEKVNIDFDAIYSSIVHEYEFSGAKKERKSSGFDCDECDWTPKANAKRPALALTLHKKEHEFSLEEVKA